MKNILRSFLIMPLLLSCSGDDDSISSTEPSCQIESLQIKSLFFDETKIGNTFNPNPPDSIHFDYDNQNRIIRVKGGVISVSSSSSFNTTWAISKNAEDIITYNQDTISVDYSSNMYFKPFAKKFVIRDNQLIAQKISYYSSATQQIIATNTHTYEYSPNEVIEKRNGILYRTFTLENGNLVKVERINTNLQTGDPDSRETYILSNYDNSPNLMKGKFFINGYFFKAFSNNNCKKIEFWKTQFVNGVEEPYDYASYTIDFGNDNGIASIFKQICE